MMTASYRNNQLNLLARRSGYNLALRHFRTTQGFAADVGDGYNLADILNAALTEGSLEEFQIRPIVNILLAEKFGYAVKSENLKHSVENIDDLVNITTGWTNIQLVFVYTDANEGVHLLNPTQPDQWEDALPLSKDEQIVCYAGSVSEVRTDVLDSAVVDAFTLLYGGKIRAKAGYKSSTEVKKIVAKEEPATQAESPDAEINTQAAESQAATPAAPSGRRKLTAKIAVNVTNELFHNGNVEAWKRIIDSYIYKYPGLDVLIWYEGERINDINALFKWGKVKHGVPIMFSVAGEAPKDISKLRKYLFEGASPRFEAFLHGAPGTILNLF